MTHELDKRVKEVEGRVSNLERAFINKAGVACGCAHDASPGYQRGGVPARLVGIEAELQRQLSDMRHELQQWKSELEVGLKRQLKGKADSWIKDATNKLKAAHEKDKSLVDEILYLKANLSNCLSLTTELCGKLGHSVPPGFLQETYVEQLPALLSPVEAEKSPNREPITRRRTPSKLPPLPNAPPVDLVTCERGRSPEDTQAELSLPPVNDACANEGPACLDGQRRRSCGADVSPPQHRRLEDSRGGGVDLPSLHEASPPQQPGERTARSNVDSSGGHSCDSFALPRVEVRYGDGYPSETESPINRQLGYQAETESPINRSSSFELVSSTGFAGSATGSGHRPMRAHQLPTVSQAARARTLRVVGAVMPRLEGPGCFDRFDNGGLCSEGRRCIQNWALGRISGGQCLLRLELCTSVAQMLEKERQDEDLDPHGGEAALLAVGCVRLGGRERQLDQIRADLEEKTPAVVLREAWRAVEETLDADAEELSISDVNNALLRLAKLARRNDAEPAAVIQVHIWREVLRVHLGIEEESKQTEDVHPSGMPSLERLDEVSDALLLDWMQREDDDLKAASQAVPTEYLSREGERLLHYAGQVIRLGFRLRKALEAGQRYDAYRVLGVPRTATLSEVKRAYFKQALLVHPDKGGDKAAFQELQRAYDDILAELKEKEEAAQRDAATAECPKQSATASTDAAPAALKGRCPGGLDRIGWFASKALAAAEAAGQCATDTLRHCRAARESLEESPANWAEGRANAEIAVTAATAVAESGKVVALLAAKVSAALEDQVLLGAPNANTLAAPPEAGVHSEPSAFERGAFATNAASGAVKMAADFCLKAVEGVTTALQQAAEEDTPSDEAANQLCVALATLAQTSKLLAVATLDAAEAAEEAASFTKQAQKSRQERHNHSANADGDALAQSAIAFPTAGEAQLGEAREEGGLEEEDDDDKAEQSEEEIDPRQKARAWRALEAQRALSTVLEATRMLRVSNLELLRIQQNAREFAAKDPAAAKGLLGNQQRAFQLLAEFFDEASVKFQDALQAAASAEDVHTADSFNNVVQRAVESTFSFLMKSSPGIALPLDPRAQTLRAATAMDAESVRLMLEKQVSRRIENALNVALIEACVCGASLTVEDGADMLGLVLDRMVDAFDELAAALQDHVTEG